MSWLKKLTQVKKRDWVFTLALALLCAFLYAMPQVKPLVDDSGRTVKATVLECDDSMLMELGNVTQGTQMLSVRITETGETFPAVNELYGKLELDKRFAPGDKITVVMPEDAAFGTVLYARDHDRSNWTIVLFSGFCLLLIIFGLWTGVKALFSFVFSCLVIFKAVIPLTLSGYSASWIIFGSTLLLTWVIIYLVAGVNRKALAASLGASAGVFAGLAMAHIFGNLLKINGATLPYSQTILDSLFMPLDIADIFVGSLILCCSGAVMDLAMDIAAAVEEVHIHNPQLTRKELTASGLRVGRSVVGTMTTTLLLAYSGGFITLIMMFALQGTRVNDVLNHPLVAAEIVKTLIGSFSLVLVAPLTAFTAGWVYSFHPKR